MRFIGSICLLLSVTRAVLVPGPTGPYAVAMKELPLTDTSRHDPLDPTGKSKSRRLLVSLYLPVDKSRRSCPAVTVPYMTPPVAASYGQQATQVGLPDTLYQPFQMEFCDLKKLSPCGQASNKNKKYPLILFEPGLEESRLIYGAMARSLASHGYVVVSVDHPFEAPAIQYPDGTIIEGIDFDPSDPKVLPNLMKVRTDDITFIINQLENQKVMKPVLADFPGAIDYKQLAIWGHSFGGATSANVINVDKRVIGGLDLDGMVTDPVLSSNVAKPFVLVGHEGHDDEDPSWNQFWPRLKGKRMELSIANTQHGAFKDDLMLVSALDLPAAAKEAIAQVLGSIDPHQLDKDLNGILMAYFDLLFHGKKQSLEAIPHNFANVTILRGNI